jgi:hypothetical protein
MPGGKAETLLKRIVTRAKRGYRGDPLGTIALYGPDDQVASKLVVGFSPSAEAGITETRSFVNAENDVRTDSELLGQVLAYLKAKHVKSLVVTDGICGCPHEEGVDYPEGAVCEYCEYWRGRARDVQLIG